VASTCAPPPAIVGHAFTLESPRCENARVSIMTGRILFPPSAATRQMEGFISFFVARILACSLLTNRTCVSNQKCDVYIAMI
jgi:hypothetical protein